VPADRVDDRHVLRGCEGYGSGSTIHTTRLLSMAEGLPVLVLVIDTEERIRAFLPELDELIAEGTVLIDEVHIRRYQNQPTP
jgi:PII-like signaling protein